MKLKKAIEKTLKERWLPISRARSYKRMIEIYLGTRCYLCLFFEPRELRSTDCTNCPLKDKGVCCCEEFSVWRKSTYSLKDFNKASKAAKDLVKRLQGLLVKEEEKI